jgi:PadR family transcriptional regulator PadR
MVLAKQTNPDFLNGVPELLVLRLLSREPMHGYELVNRLEQLAAVPLQFPQGSIYPVLHRLEADRLIVSRREKKNGRTRIVYRVTAAGKRALDQRESTWREIVACIDRILGAGGSHVGENLA